MPKINIFLVGQRHDDPATKYLLLQELQRAQAAGITVAVFAAAPSALPLRKTRQLTELNFNISSVLLNSSLAVLQYFRQKKENNRASYSVKQSVE